MNTPRDKQVAVMVKKRKTQCERFRDKLLSYPTMAGALHGAGAGINSAGQFFYYRSARLAMAAIAIVLHACSGVLKLWKLAGDEEAAEKRQEENQRNHDTLKAELETLKETGKRESAEVTLNTANIQATADQILATLQGPPTPQQMQLVEQFVNAIKNQAGRISTSARSIQSASQKDEGPKPQAQGTAEAETNQQVDDQQQGEEESDGEDDQQQDREFQDDEFNTAIPDV